MNANIFLSEGAIGSPIWADTVKCRTDVKRIPHYCFDDGSVIDVFVAGVDA